jgi:hypothetical protein
MRLIGVYNADGGIAGELSYFFGHLVGVRSCTLCDITHSPFAKKSSWKMLEKSLMQDLNIEFVLVHKNERTAQQHAASEGREPCVLLEDAQGNLVMLLDWNDLTLAHGNVAKFERTLRAKLLMY